jgi:hypothetical protein
MRQQPARLGSLLRLFFHFFIQLLDPPLQYSYGLRISFRLKLRQNNPTEGNSMYNAVCLEVQDGNPGLGCMRS